MPEYKVTIEVTLKESGRVILNYFYEAEWLDLRRLIFAVDPNTASRFAIDTTVNVKPPREKNPDA